MLQHALQADAVVRGRAIGLNAVDPNELLHEHSPQWWIALTLDVDLVQRGDVAGVGEEGGRVDFLYANSLDIRWRDGRSRRPARAGCGSCTARPPMTPTSPRSRCCTARTCSRASSWSCCDDAGPIVNMIPRSLSRETEQDSEPSIAVNPANPQQIVATAFTPDPAGGPRAPVFVSTDGGATWALRTIVPGGQCDADISIGFAGQGGELYAGTSTRPPATSTSCARATRSARRR